MSSEEWMPPQAAATEGLLWITSCVVGAATPFQRADTAAAWAALESALASADGWDTHRDTSALARVHHLAQDRGAD